MHIAMSLRNRILIAWLLPLLLVAVPLLALGGVLYYRTLDQALLERGRIEARHLAAATAAVLRTGDRQQLELLAGNVRQFDGDVVAATILDEHRQALAGSGRSALTNQALGTGGRGFVENGVLLVVEPVRDALASEDDLGTADADSRSAGWVVLELSREGLQRELRRLLAFILAVTLCGLLLGALVATRIAKGVTGPLQHMSEVVQRIAGGDLAARVTPDPDGVARPLEEGINQMAQRMVTNREQQSVRIAAATAELRARKDEAERAAAAKSRFLAAASHDLRQPMHALGLFVSRLASLDVNPEAQGILRRIEDSVSALDSLFDAMLDVSRIDAGLVVPDPQAVAVADLLERVARESAPSAATQGLDLRWRAAPELRLHADPALVERILANLTGNALRYTGHGGVLLTARRVGGMVRLAVWDTGIGIPVDSQQIIFDEYVQLGNPERDRAKGLGLGLSICHRLARLLGTRIHLRSIPGKGSVFWFDLPEQIELQARQAVVASAVTAAADVPVSGRLSGTVVVVDDDDLVLSSTADLLESWGCEVIAASSVADALLECAETERRPDVAIVDYRLRGFENGLHSARALRERFGAIPVMMLTGDMSEQFRLDAAANDFQVMAKPLKPARLRAMLQHMLAPGTAADVAD